MGTEYRYGCSDCGDRRDLGKGPVEAFLKGIELAPRFREVLGFDVFADRDWIIGFAGCSGPLEWLIGHGYCKITLWDSYGYSYLPDGNRRECFNCRHEHRGMMCQTKEHGTELPCGCKEFKE